MSKLALGTVQFGLDYGIKNDRGRIPESEIGQILDEAMSGGIDLLDTACAYGSSETVLGILAGKTSGFSIISKLPAKSEASVAEELAGSLARLGRKTLYGYMLHNFSTYQAHPSVMRDLAACKAQGLVEKIGASLYFPSEAETLLEDDVPLDLVQVPYNLLDRRFEKVFPLLKARGVEIHTRSAFLQGLFFLDQSRLGGRFETVRMSIARLQALATESGFGLPTLCLGFAAACPHVDRVVIGVDTINDLRANLASWSQREHAKKVLVILGDISSEDENIILPYKWEKR